MQQQDNPDDLLCASQICKLLQISRRTFCRLRQTGKLPPPVVAWNRNSMRWRRGDVLAIGMHDTDAQYFGTEGIAAVGYATKHLRAANSAAQAAMHHTNAAATALRRLQINSACQRDIDTANAIAATALSNTPPPSFPEGAD